ncbi:metallophosphoesterase family protein [Paraburkholderia silvatlantica]|uniref:metallophosphoesterase family protein n=1 Tax=Paraburkholderia silvatlantica TaxID=321895 RepID=UPI0037509D5F
MGEPDTTSMDGEESRTEAVVVLDIHPDEFGCRQLEFVSALSNLLEIDASDVLITDYQAGCTIVFLLLPGDAAENLRLALNRQLEDPAVGGFVNEFRVRNAWTANARLRPVMPVTQDKNNSRIFSWVHISDIHFQNPDGKHYAAQGAILKSFLDALPPALKSFSKNPDAVFFTGDVAHSGDPSEYDLAEEFLARLKEILPNQDCQILIVPGNHDVHRPDADRYPDDEKFAQANLKTQLNVVELEANADRAGRFSRLLSRLDNYRNFVKNCTAVSKPEINHEWFFTHRLEKNPFSIGIAGLNSAWRASSDKDRGRLIIGLPQIEKAEDNLNSCNIRVLLAHHPLASDWFCPFDEDYQEKKLKFFDVVVRGHEHRGRSKLVAGPKGKPNPWISGAALYSREERPRGFNICRLNLDKGWLEAVFWYHDDDFNWTLDTSERRNGIYHYTLSTETQRRLGRKRR